MDLMRPLRIGDLVRCPSGHDGMVIRPADGSGRIVVRYSRPPEWQPTPEDGTKYASVNGIDEVTMHEHLVKLIRAVRRK